MVIDRISVLVLGLGVGFGLVHAVLVEVPGCFEVFQDVSGSAVNGHGLPRWLQRLDVTCSPPRLCSGAEHLAARYKGFKSEVRWVNPESGSTLRLL
jgi:hypothetical protein